MKKDYKLYNMILPPFMLMFMAPLLLAITLAGNFIIDSIVLLAVSLFVFKKIDWKFYGKTIFKVWGLGFAGDIVGVIFLNILGQIGYFYINTNHTDKSFPYSLFNSMNNVLNHSYEVTPYTTGILISGIVVAAVSIFMFNYFISFRRATSVYGFTRTQRALASLAFAVVTAPYTFLLPYEMFY